LKTIISFNKFPGKPAAEFFGPILIAYKNIENFSINWKIFLFSLLSKNIHDFFVSEWLSEVGGKSEGGKEKRD
jgi:hypothetical protein